MWHQASPPGLYQPLHLSLIGQMRHTPAIANPKLIKKPKFKYLDRYFMVLGTRKGFRILEHFTHSQRLDHCSQREAICGFDSGLKKYSNELWCFSPDVSTCVQTLHSSHAREPLFHPWQQQQQFLHQFEEPLAFSAST